MPSVREGRNQAGDRINITAAEQAATLTVLPGAGFLSAQVKATAFTGVITFEITQDGVNWDAIELMTTADQTDTSLTTTATNPTAGQWTSKGAISCSGFRARCSTFTSQTAAFVSVRWSR
jgi:hypothetical protein